ncbi:MAG: hypothetical protein QNJ70_00975 [Xenococcaceae cyanobacterium MO_207.B15]|nr:hypothetical protein [Xenococcaceae cyanobacterium MO_207.B15]
MKNIQKIGVALTFIALSSFGCSNDSTKEVSSDISSATETTIDSGKEALSDLSSATESTIDSGKEALSNVSSIIENPVVGEKVTLQGRVIGEMEDCHIFTDGKNKIMVHFEDENISFDPSNVVEISGTIKEGVMAHAHHFAKEEHQNISTDTMIMVNTIEVISSIEKS